MGQSYGIELSDASHSVMIEEPDCTANSTITLTLYNSLGWARSEFAAIPTSCVNILSVTDVNGEVSLAVMQT